MPELNPSPSDPCYGAWFRCRQGASQRKVKCGSSPFCDWVYNGDMLICAGAYARCKAAQGLQKVIEIGQEIIAIPVPGTPYNIGQVIVIAGTAYIIIQLLPVLLLAIA